MTFRFFTENCLPPVVGTEDGETLVMLKSCKATFRFVDNDLLSNS